jgi:pimeloyl-ACP methyl ester carboxylesterase
MTSPLTARSLPPETVAGLRPPRPGFPYFAHADHFRLEPDASDYSAVNAWWLADACFVVYGDPAFIEATLQASPLPALGFQLDWLGTRTDNRGMVLSNSDVVVIVFRGTRLQMHALLDVAEIVLINRNDLWTDSRFLRVACRAGGQVHAGFNSAFAEISDTLDAIVCNKRPEQRLWLTGHSLGGALATLAAAHLGTAAVQGLYTYGSPRVGNVAFVAELPRESHCRFVHRDDWVPTVPPEFTGYVHGGTLQTVPGSPPRRLWNDFTSGAGEFAAALKAMAGELRVSVRDLPFRIPGLADHAPIYYATLLWNALPGVSVQVNAADSKTA